MKKLSQQFDADKHIFIEEANENNLKDVSLLIPRDQLIVITGVSGSGKSSLAYDTLYAEGQRRYIESLSSYARQFLGKIQKPKVKSIKGIAPAIAIKQKVNTGNPRSTVGTATEIYDYLKLLYARIGKTISPKSGLEVKKHSVADVLHFLKEQEEKSRWILSVKLEAHHGKDINTIVRILEQQGYARLKIKNDIIRIDEALKDNIKSTDLELVIDRIQLKNDEDYWNRLADSIQKAFFEGHGELILTDWASKNAFAFSQNFSLDGIDFPEPNIHLFSFNTPYGACQTCDGFGSTLGIDPQKVIPNTTLSIYEEAVACWRGNSLRYYKDEFVKNAHKFDFPIHTPWFELSPEQQKTVWEGNKYVMGINAFFAEIESKSYKIQNRVLLSRYRGKTVCPACHGKRLRQEAFYVQVGGKNIGDLVEMSIEKLQIFFKNLQLSDYDAQVAKRILLEINTRLEFLMDVGLSYLTLNRASNTLSGGETQRINLSTSLGSSLVGSIYVLDEPSIGLHPKDTERLIKVLKNLRDIGNTVVVVEHDEDIMKAADQIIDMGPEAGSLGGKLVAQGSFKEILKSQSLTAQYLNGKLEIKVPEIRRKSKDFIKIIGARENNLKNIDVRFPLHTLTAITGVSGSGKSSLASQIIYPAIHKHIHDHGPKIGQFSKLEGALKQVAEIEYINQNPIGRSSRSNPVTYIKAYDDIRSLFAGQKLSKIRKFQAKHFSFNIEGGRCEYCKGEGVKTIEMQFMADVHLTCEECNGKRFKDEVLEVTFEGKNISDILEMSVDEALVFFNQTKQKKIVDKLKPLQDVGLGYISLGQSSSTLSGGEAQRIKLASFLVKGNKQAKTLFIFDEPTTGLHFHDIKKLLDSFNALIENGHSVLVIEHNIEIIKSADWIIDLGPEGGDKGGNLVFQGTPEDLLSDGRSLLTSYLQEKLDVGC
jgi:excinuclease ABC subunit A